MKRSEKLKVAPCAMVRYGEFQVDFFLDPKYIQTASEVCILRVTLEERKPLLVQCVELAVLRVK